MDSKLNAPLETGFGFVQPPIVYVKDEPAWEYRRLVRNLAKDEPPSEEEMNALGKDGWELAGLFTDSPFVYLYFKRLAR